MKKITVCFLLFLSIAAGAQQSPEIAIIPQPVSLEKKGGSFELNNYSIIEIAEKNADLQMVARYLAQQLLRATGYPMNVQLPADAKDSRGSTIAISLNRKEDTRIGNEGYTLEVGSSLVILRANKPAGLFYGVQTLLQLMPKEVESADMVKKNYWIIPGVKIIDYPRFGWRGLMLDVSRHFFNKQEVQRYIDDMVKYKYNLLHLHLTDDQGWRIEIKAYPKLTEVGAWRVDKTGQFNTFSKPEPDEPRTYGGFFTQQDIKDIVQYAKDRFVNILPEIDVPGHSLAALAAYPELSCTPGTYQVNSGEKFMEWPAGGHFYGLVDNTLCPANDKVYEFLDKVFTEVAALFPFEYIHMGGDETARNFWEKSEQIKNLMKRENLKNLDEVQSYFVKKVEKIIMSKGKKLIGWDEILDGGLAPNAAVMSWRGMKGGIEAAKLGHEVVMSPTTFVYIDYMQGDVSTEPPVYASLRMKKSYEFEPLPDGVNEKLIKGGQANLWTEQIYNLRQAQYMTWPRGMAISECLWSPKQTRNWMEFVARAEKHFERLDQSETKYSRGIYDPIISPKKDANGKLQIELATEIDGLDIYYSFDNSEPDRFYPKYTGVLTPPKDAVRFRVVTYRGKEKMGRSILVPIADLNKRAGIK